MAPKKSANQGDRRKTQGPSRYAGGGQPRPKDIEEKSAETVAGNRPRRGHYRQLLIQSFTSWHNVEQIQQALYMLEVGNFRPAAQLLNAMKRDDRFVAVSDSLIDGIFSLEIEIRPPDGHTEDVAKLAAQLVQERWAKIFSIAEASLIFSWGSNLGVSLHEKIWTTDDRRMWWPRIKAWDMMFSWWNVGTHTYWLNTDPTGSETQGETGETTVEIPENGDDHWGIFSPYGGSEGWFSGIIRAAAMPWMIREWGLRDWARFNEIFGIPARAAYVPSWASDNQREAFIAQLQNMGNEPVLELPIREGNENGFDYKVVQATVGQGGVDAFDKLLAYIDKALAVLVLGQNLTTDVKGGSHAAAKVHENVRADKIARWTRALEQWIHDQLLVPIMVYNFGPEYAELAPWARFIVEPPEDMVQKAQTFLSVGQGMVAYDTAGAPIDKPAILDQYGIARTLQEVPEDGDDQGAEPAPAPPESGPGDRPQPPKPGSEAQPAKSPGPPPPAGMKQKPVPPHLTALANERGIGRKADGPKRLPASSVRGQGFIDSVADRGKAQMAKLMRGDLRELLAAIDGATSYEDARKKVLMVYGAMLPEIELRELLENAITLGQLAGRTAIHERNRE